MVEEVVGDWETSGILKAWFYKEQKYMAVEFIFEDFFSKRH